MSLARIIMLSALLGCAPRSLGVEVGGGVVDTPPAEIRASDEPFVTNPRFCIPGTVGTGCELALTVC
jgi:hypothetical protein